VKLIRERVAIVRSVAPRHGGRQQRVVAQRQRLALTCPGLWCEGASFVGSNHADEWTTLVIMWGRVSGSTSA